MDPGVGAGRMAEPVWNDLPSELLLKIANSCPGTGGMRGVSRTWQTGLESLASKLRIRGSPLPPNLGQRYPLLSSLCLQGCSTMTPELLQSIQSLHQQSLQQQLSLLKSLTLALGVQDLTEALLEPLRGLSLEKLDLGLRWPGQEFTDATLQLLQGLPVINLNLSHTRVSPAGLTALRGLLLTSLHLPTHDGLGDSDLEVLRGMPLTALHLHGENDMSGSTPHNLSDTCLGFLRGMPLTVLDLDSADSFSDSGLEVLAGMPLKDLILLRAASITDVGLRVLKGMSLVTFHLAGSDEVTDAGLEVLRGMPISDLNLLDTWCLTDDIFPILRDLPLVKLNLGWNKHH